MIGFFGLFSVGWSQTTPYPYTGSTNAYPYTGSPYPYPCNYYSYQNQYPSGSGCANSNGNVPNGTLNLSNTAHITYASGVFQALSQTGNSATGPGASISANTNSNSYSAPNGVSVDSAYVNGNGGSNGQVVSGNLNNLDQSNSYSTQGGGAVAHLNSNINGSGAGLSASSNANVNGYGQLQKMKSVKKAPAQPVHMQVHHGAARIKTQDNIVRLGNRKVLSQPPPNKDTSLNRRYKPVPHNVVQKTQRLARQR